MIGVTKKELESFNVKKNQVFNHLGGKKIIATTDSKLTFLQKAISGSPMTTEYYLNQISTESLQEFVKRYNDGTLGKEVMLEMEQKVNKSLSVKEPFYNYQIKTSSDNTVSLMFEGEELYHLTKSQLQKLACNAVSADYDDGVLNIDIWLKENYHSPTIR